MDDATARLTDDEVAWLLGQVAYLSGLVSAPPVHLAVTRSLEVLTAILDDLAAEQRVPRTRITADRGTLDWFDQTIDAIAADSDPVPFAVARGRAVAVLEERIAERLDEAISHMAACTTMTREGVIRALAARFEADGPAGDRPVPKG
jgi:hypothetical protein